ncbi:MAG: MarR family winged helix-turn-helix transcriptional regulator [Alphaproteobacteria bacterium]
MMKIIWFDWFRMKGKKMVKGKTATVASGNKASGGKSKRPRISGRSEFALTSPAHCLCANLRKTARAMTQGYDAALLPAGISSPQFTLLATLTGNEAITVSELAGQLGMDRTTLTRNLKPLERDGLISVREGDDRRARIVDLTAKGRRIYGKAKPLWAAQQGRVVAAFGAGAARAMLVGLGRLGGAIQ